MEIRIKTAAEFHSGNVTIEIHATQDEVPEISQRLTGGDPAEALEVMTENYQRARTEVDPLEIRLETVRQERANLEAELARMADNFNTSQTRVEELETKARELAERAELELARASTEAKAKLKDLQNRLDEAEETISGLTTRIGRISGAVQGTAIKSALGRAWSGWNETEAVAVVNAVRDVRSIIGIPLS